MTLNEQQLVGELVAKDFRTAEVFRKHKIDFCCGGGISLKAASEKKNIDVAALINELETITEVKTSLDNYNTWNLSFLADYIVNTHHAYLKAKLPEICFYANKVARVHGDRHPELLQILEHVLNVNDEMLAHMEKEERVLFPFIKALETATNAKQNLEKPSFGTVENPIKVMISEHESAGNEMEEIQKLTTDFTPPDDACTTYRVFFQNLDAFQQDLHKHVHLENNILFPKALSLEVALNSVH